MLQPPYTKYDQLYVYHLDLPEVPELVDPDLIGAWQEDNTVILFFHQDKEAFIKEFCREKNCQVVYQADLSYLDWEAGHEIKPFKMGPLTVAPVWEPGPADIRLDPSVIFGSGFHPTTRLCLQELITLAVSAPEQIYRALDLGCGTALLAIAAAKLAIKNTQAMDINNLACRVAAANVERNQTGDRVEVIQRDLMANPPITKGVDLVMANLYRGLLSSLFANPDFWEARYYIISGFMVHMEEGILAELPTDKLRFLARHRQDKWCVWVLARR